MSLQPGLVTANDEPPALDGAWLGAWVQPQHLEIEHLRDYHRGFTSHPARLLVIRRFLVDQVAESLSRFLTDEAEFRTVYGLNSLADRYATEGAWLAADDGDRLLKFGRLAGAKRGCELSPNLLMYLRFRRAFDDPRFRALFVSICGVPLGSTYFDEHSMRRGDFLRPHTDAVANRRLAFVLYLSADWHAGFGGATHLWDPDDKISVIEAEYNTLLLFDVKARTQHAVATIEPAAGSSARLTIGGWMFDPA